MFNALMVQRQFETIWIHVITTFIDQYNFF